ncbi:MAG: DUF4034 domain-containing protein [Cyanobacteria bacterium SZAS-4]|nr:DUF4034 domain-containing protein [Cyanobacteria bacterium SZAS-4]
MDNEKLAEAELKQKLVVNEPTSLADKPIDVAESDTCAETDAPTEGCPNSFQTRGKKEPALIPVKPKPRGEQKPPVPAAVRKARNLYIAIALTTTLIGVVIAPLAWSAWTMLKFAHPESKGVEFFLQPKERSKERADDWRDKMRHLIVQASKMPKPPSSKLATGYGDPRVGHKALTLLLEKKFDELNKLFADASTNRVEHRTGSELRDDLLKALSDPGDIQGPYWQERLALLQQWADFKPESATPHIVLADFYIHYAWNARGSGWAAQVKEWQWKLFKDRLYLSTEQLEKALKFGTPSPEWFAVAQVNILGAGNREDRHLFESITKLGNKFYPNYVPIYLNKVYYLQPRWYGDGLEWVDYVARQADAVGGTEGDKLYARMVNKVAHLYNNLYEEAPKLNKKRVERGNELLDKQFGGVK